MINIGVIREGKIPPDERVVLTPMQIQRISKAHSNINIEVQSSPIRRIKDSEYLELGVEVKYDVSSQDILIGVKEIPVDQLVAGKTCFFFSHTIKMQPYNKGLLKEVLNKNITLIDWECLTDARGRRLIGFGRYAGIVGTYNGFRAYGLKHGRFKLKRATDCEDRMELQRELEKVRVPPIKILLSGRGKVAKGSMEILDRLGIRKVGIREYLKQEFNEPVYCQITFQDYFKRMDGKEFDTASFLEDGTGHKSDFMRFARLTDYYIAGHYWDSSAPFIFTREDARSPDFKISLVADISCDIDGPVACTLRPSTIDDPFYGYDPVSESEVAFDTPNSISVMAVDNLPCELPRDASHDFGEMFIHGVLPSLLNGDKHGILKRATIAKAGNLTDDYQYLKGWLES